MENSSSVVNKRYSAPSVGVSGGGEAVMSGE